MPSPTSIHDGFFQHPGIMGHFQVTLCLCFKMSSQNEPVGGTHFDMNGLIQTRVETEAQGNLEMTY